MSQEPSPYQVSESSVSSNPMGTPPPSMPSSIPKVFGIIHIIYAGLGILTAAASVGAVAAMKAFIPEGQAKELDTMLKAYESMANYAYVDVLIKVIFGIVLIVAGIGLLKKKSWSVGLSIFWSIARMVTMIVFTIVLAGPTKAFQEKVQAASSGGAEMQEFQQMATGIGNIVGVVMVCIYPVLCIIFLSKKRVKQSFQ